MGRSPIFEVLWGTKERGLCPRLGKTGWRGAEVTREGGEHRAAGSGLLEEETENIEGHLL